MPITIAAILVENMSTLTFSEANEASFISETGNIACRLSGSIMQKRTTQRDGFPGKQRSRTYAALYQTIVYPSVRESRRPRSCRAQFDTIWNKWTAWPQRWNGCLHRYSYISVYKWPWPLIPDLENLFSNFHSYDEHTWLYWNPSTT